MYCSLVLSKISLRKHLVIISSYSFAEIVDWVLEYFPVGGQVTYLVASSSSMVSGICLEHIID